MELSPIPSAIQSGLSGVQKAQNGLAESAQNIASLNTNSENPVLTAAEAPLGANTSQQNPASVLTTEAVNLVVNEHLAKANINVIRTADEVLGTLIDTKA